MIPKRKAKALQEWIKRGKQERRQFQRRNNNESLDVWKLNDNIKYTIDSNYVGWKNLDDAF